MAMPLIAVAGAVKMSHSGGIRMLLLLGLKFAMVRALFEKELFAGVECSSMQLLSQQTLQADSVLVC